MGDAQNEPKKEEGEKKVLHTYALVRVCSTIMGTPTFFCNLLDLI